MFTVDELEEMRLADREINQEDIAPYIDLELDKWLDKLAILDRLNSHQISTRQQKEKYWAGYGPANREHRRSYDVAYYASNKGKRSAYYAAHRAEILARQARYDAGRKDLKSAYDAARYAERRKTAAACADTQTTAREKIYTDIISN